MREVHVKALPPEAFARGIQKLRPRAAAKNVVILGFDTEYRADDQEIICYQLSDGEAALGNRSPYDIRLDEFTHSELLETTVDLTWPKLSEWVLACLRKWGYAIRDIDTILLVSHFSTAELSHLDNFWEDAEVRRVSAAQVYNASYNINKSLRLVVMDNYHFWNVGNNGAASLFAVAQKFGEHKIELPKHLPIEKTTRDYLAHDEFRRYALWDAVLCARVFRKFRQRLLDEYGVDVIQYPTSAALAMAVYRQHFLPETFDAPEPRLRRQAWLSLWGGRAEAYAAGDFFGEYTLRDVVSLYPSSEKLLHYLPRAQDWIVRAQPESWRGLCRVQFKLPDTVKFPCLPVCHDGRLIFPLEGVSDCSLDEAKLAEDLGAELNFLHVQEYDVGDDSLTRFMQFFIKQKADADVKGDMVQRELAKLMMNSLIGKLSQNKGDVDVEAMKQFSAKIGVPLEVCMSPRFLHPEKPKAVPRIGGHIMPEWSALILGKARAIMAALLNGVGESLICSTDSMLVPKHLNSVVDEVMKRVGVELTDKNKGLVTHRVRVVRNRVYGGETKEGKIVFGASHAIHLGYRARNCAACESGDCRLPEHNAIRFILSEKTEYQKIRRTGLKTAIRKGERFFSEKEVKMEFKRAWDKKRRLLPNGQTVPWRSLAEYDAQNLNTPYVTIEVA